jgi:NADH-quinone oxidoreductase subunit E
MLSEQERREIDEQLAHLPTKQAGCVDALKVVQKRRGWVSDEALEDLSPVLGMTAADMDSVATFYNLIFRRPVGRHVILVCDSVSCWLTGEETILQHLERRLGVRPGQTTGDGEFTLLPTVCLGHCEQAPVMMLDGEIVGNLTPEKIDGALDAARNAKEPGG